MGIDYSIVNQVIDGLEYGMILWNKLLELGSIAEIYHFGYNFPLVTAMEYIPNKYGWSRNTRSETGRLRTPFLC
jgi:hypothetical protein